MLTNTTTETATTAGSIAWAVTPSVAADSMPPSESSWLARTSATRVRGATRCGTHCQGEDVRGTIHGVAEARLGQEQQRVL